ncbi:MAG: DUF445 domain-containing protein [Desulfitobacteriaceae bacterium]
MNYKQKANIILTSIFILFLIAAIGEYFWPNILFVRISFFVTEAALIGGIADWFAITALFKKPLNWPFHTALIPRNREKVINSVSLMVQQDLLNLVLIRQKIEQVNLSELILRWIEEGERLSSVINAITQTIESWLRQISPETVSSFLTPILKKQLVQLRLFPLAQDFVFKSLSNGQMNSWFDSIIVKLDFITKQETTKTYIYNLLQEQKTEKINQGSINKFMVSMLEVSGGLNLAEAAEAIQAQLKLTVEQLKNQEHPLRHSIKGILRHNLAELEQNLTFQEEIENWKEEIIAKLPLDQILEDSIKALQEIKATDGKNPLDSILHETLEGLWLHCRKSDFFSIQMNGYLYKVISSLLEFNQTIIGDIAKAALSKLTNEDLIQFIEDKAGNDLQWIRINGSIIGGLVGFVLFVFLRLIYDPYVVPFINQLLL